MYRPNRGFIRIAIMGCVLLASGITPSLAQAANSPDNAIAINSAGQCAAIRQYFDPSIDTKVPAGWTVYTGERLDLYETPVGNCRFSPTYDATCCRQLGLTYTEYESQRVLQSSKEAVSICGGGLGSSNLYCKNRPAETRNATVNTTCGYSTLGTSGLIINKETKYCSLVTKASTYSRIYTISGDQLGTSYDVKDSRDFTKDPTNCPVPEVKGTIYQPLKIEKGIWHEQRWCDLSKVSNIGDCCQALGLTTVAIPINTGGGIMPWLLLSTLIGLGAIIGLIIVIRRHQGHKATPAVTGLDRTPAAMNSQTTPAHRRSWVRNWWWLVIVIPILMIGWFVAWVWVGSSTVTGAFVVASLCSLGAFGLSWLWWRRGKTGKFLAIITVLAAIVLFLPAGYQTRRNSQNYIRIHREAADTEQLELISLAENLDCPPNQSCLEPLSSIASAQKSNSGPLDLDEIKFNIHTEVDYYAKIDSTFPGSFSWPKPELSGGQISEPKYFSSDGQIITAQQCQELAGPKFSVVGLWMDYNYYCPLCGSGGVSERRVYFSDTHQPVCQALYEYGSWIS